MAKVRIDAEMSDRLYEAYRAEAERRNVPVEELVARLVAQLIRDMEREEEQHAVWVP